ncbi:hypothetical protein ACFFRR_006103 [Megaselia abdita]
MVLKDINVRENISMDSGTRTSLTARRGCTLSVTSLALLGAFFACTLLAVSFIVYNFASCQQIQINHEHNKLEHNEQQNQTPHYLKDNHHINLPIQSVEENSIEEGFITTPKTLSVDKDVRLPRSIVPVTYNVSIIPFLVEGNFTFHGFVRILVNITEDCNNITLHATDLDIMSDKTTVKDLEGNVFPINNTRTVEDKQFFIIMTKNLLKKDMQLEIEMKFIGQISDNLQGFYRSSYENGSGEKRWIASTQFQPTDARRAFPCFDEPSLKARFTMNIAVPDGMIAISNMPRDIKGMNGAVENFPSYTWNSFEQSVPMSTYLVAFAVTDFRYLSTGNFSVFARPDAIGSASYALSIGPKILRFLEDFFQIPYPLPKMDMIALPDFNAGAMENWGLITYREATMLFEEGVSASPTKQKVASVVAHELVHQWFGNLVTPSWWSDIWLNEGFASYMEYLVVDEIARNWRTMDQFVVNELHGVLVFDALSSSHKISVQVGNPDEINEIFDRISYGKGATIIRMMDHFLTSKIFRLGLKNYLNEMKYKSAEQDDLWKYLTEVAVANNVLDKKNSVKEIMDTWTLQTGFPVVKVSIEQNLVTLEQERFVYSNTSKAILDLEDSNPLWWIPISFTTSEELNFNHTQPSQWVPRTSKHEFEDAKLGHSSWHIFNIQQTGYYRVNYELKNWKAITAYLTNINNFKKISPTNRAQLVDDAMNLARGGYLSYEIALNLSTYLQLEDDYVPWKAAITTFDFIDGMFVRQGDYHLLKNYLLRLLTYIYNSVGFKDSHYDMLTVVKREEILSMACKLGHEDCIRQSINYFENWKAVTMPDRENPISPNLRSIVYCSSIEAGSDKEWDFAYERYKNSKVSSEKETLLTALGCSKEPWVLARYLKYAISGKYIRKQDIFRVFAAVSSNAVGQQLAFDFVRSNWDEIKAYLGSTMNNMYTILSFPTKKMNTKYQLIELEDFIKQKFSETPRSIQQTIEQIKVNIDWMDSNYETIVNWLQKQTIYN